MSPKDTDQRLWKIEYASLVNQYYYEILKRRWLIVERLVFAVTLVASLADLVVLSLGFLGPLEPSTELLGAAAGIIAVVLLCLALVMPVDSVLRRQEKLYDQWTDLRGRCERLHVILDASEAGRVAAPYLDELDEIIRTHTEIQKSEGRANEQLLRLCQNEINKRTYGVAEGTYQEVMQKVGAGSA